MKIRLLILCLFCSYSVCLFGQNNDSTEVKQTAYDYPDSDKNEIVRVTAQQLKANSDYHKGYSFVDNHDYKKAIKSFKKAIDIDSTGNCGTGTNGTAFAELGYAYTRSGDIKNAMATLDKAIEINKFVPTPYLSKSVLLMQQGKNDSALVILNSLIVNVPNYAMAYVQRGFFYNSTGEYGFALQDFNEFLDLTKRQNQEQNSASLIAEIKRQVLELEAKVKQ